MKSCINTLIFVLILIFNSQCVQKGGDIYFDSESELKIYERGLLKISVDTFHIDSSKYYVEKVDSLLHTYNKIDSIKFESYPLLINVYLMERQHKKAEMLAKELIDFDNYSFQPVDNVKSIALSTYAYLIFRDLKYYAAYKILTKAIMLSDNNINSKSYQLALRNWMLISAKEGNEDNFHNYKFHYDKIINEADTFHYNMYRVYAEYYALKKDKEKEALYWLEKAINHIEIRQPNYAIKSTLYFYLADVYTRLQEYDNVLKIYYQDLYLNAHFDINRLLSYKQNDVPYGYITIVEIAETLLLKYKKNKNISDLLLAEDLIVKCDSILSKQPFLLNLNRELSFLSHSDDLLDVALGIFYELHMLDRTNEIYINTIVNIIHKNRTFTHKKEKTIRDILGIDLYKDYFIIRKEIGKSNTYSSDNSVQFREDLLRLDELQSKFDHINVSENDYISSNFWQVNHIQDKLREHNVSLLAFNQVDTNQIFRVLIDPLRIEVALLQLNTSNMQSINELMRYSYDPFIPIRKQYKTIFDYLVPEISTDKLLIMNDGITGELNWKKILNGHGKKIDVDLLLDFESVDKLDINQDQSLKRMAVFAFSNSSTIRERHKHSNLEIPFTHKEAQYFLSQFPGQVDIYSGREATKSKFIQVCEDSLYSHIHLALHGHSSGETREDISLLFRNQEFGIDTLYGYEIPLLNRKKSVVLSACDSNNGIYTRGEGKYSLARYFLKNGSELVKANHGILEDNGEFDYSKFYMIY